VDTKIYKYNRIIQKGIKMVEHVFVYGYVCIGIVGLALIGLVVFSWLAIRRLTRVLRQ
jgi:hypothetical protein